MLLPRIGCIFQRPRPQYHRILVTSTALIKRKTRHSSSCLEVGRYLKLLCACANVATTCTAMATKPPRSQAFLLGMRLVDRQNERFSPSGRAGSRLLRLFTPQAAEASRIHPSSPLAAAAWSCLSSEKISDPPKIHRNKKKKRFLQNVKRYRDHYAKKHSNKV